VSDDDTVVVTEADGEVEAVTLTEAERLFETLLEGVNETDTDEVTLAVILADFVPLGETEAVIEMLAVVDALREIEGEIEVLPVTDTDCTKQNGRSTRPMRKRVRRYEGNEEGKTSYRKGKE
jgi:hypothetical protein